MIHRERINGNFGHLMRRADSLGRTLKLGKTEGRRSIGQQSMRWLYGITDAMDMSLSRLQEIVKDREVCLLLCVESQRVENDLETEQQRGNTPETK